MRLRTPRYPVDRYLVESSKTMDMDKLLGDLWKPEPTLGLEDEIMLRELHGMLQSTADDLRMLSAELSKYHEPRVQVKPMPTPLDEDYNEQMHIDEIVDAKLHGLEPGSSQSTVTPLNISKIVHEIVANKLQNANPIAESVIQKPKKHEQRKPLKKLSISRTKILHIAENKEETNNDKSENTKKHQAPTKNIDDRTVYKEIVHEYVEPKKESLVVNSFNVQKMPSINIRSELRTQNVVQLDILPDNKDLLSNSENKSNVAVISVLHELPSTSQKESHESFKYEQPPVRKVFKMASYESSDTSYNNITEDKQTDYKHKTTRKTLDRRKDSKVHYSNTDISKDVKKPRSNLNEWKKKLNTIYGQSARTLKSSSKNTNANLKSQTLQVPVNEPDNGGLNNTAYIPYTKLTLGGVTVKDIERELSHVSRNQDVPLSPILDKILSRQNSFSHDNSHKNKDEKILTTSDENLLQEVLDIEEKVISTLSKNKNSYNTLSPRDLSNNEDDNTYADDFEIDNSRPSSDKSEPTPMRSDSPKVTINTNNINERTTAEPDKTNENISNTTYVKVSNLSFKNHIDTFEFIHTIDRKDNATQSNAMNKTSLKETQTSPRYDNDTIQTIRNDLSIDPRHEIENMFKMEKDFIKKLIIDEYSDIIEKNVNKPSTSYDSKIYSDDKNVATIQKNTQTSPARVKNVMTSPTRTKTRTTSPFALSVTVHKQTSPMAVVSNKGISRRDSPDEIHPIESKVTIDQEDHNITINLSSPRFSLRLPQSSCDLSNSDRHSRTKKVLKPKPFIPSSSSSKEDYSSSDISFGEINREFKRRLRRHKIPCISEPSSSSLSKYSDRSSIVAPLRSEGEISVCQTRSNKYSKSEGEISLGQVKRH